MLFPARDRETRAVQYCSPSRLVTPAPCTLRLMMVARSAEVMGSVGLAKTPVCVRICWNAALRFGSGTGTAAVGAGVTAGVVAVGTLVGAGPVGARGLDPPLREQAICVPARRMRITGFKIDFFMAR